jgi:hypothetical protein
MFIRVFLCRYVGSGARARARCCCGGTELSGLALVLLQMIPSDSDAFRIGRKIEFCVRKKNNFPFYSLIFSADCSKSHGASVKTSFRYGGWLLLKLWSF